MIRLFGTDDADSLVGGARVDMLSGGTRRDPADDQGDDTLRGLDRADLLRGWAGDDSLVGGDGADTLAGGEGDDALLGGAGRDLLIGGAGPDRLDGGPGDDTISPSTKLFGAPEFNIVEGGAGRDWLTYESEPFERVVISLGGGLSYDVVSGVENLRGGHGGDRLTGDAGRNRLEGLGGEDTLGGGDGADTLIGGDEDGLGDVLDGGTGRDSLEGGGGFDALHGGAGRDWLDGGAVFDRLSGDAGRDTITGGDGADTLAGGTGRDVFRFTSPAEGGDLILDYAPRRDGIEVSAAGFAAGLVPGMDLDAAERMAVSRGGLPDRPFGQFLFDRLAATLSWDPDGTGPEAAVLLATLEGVRRWSGAEIIVVA
ncbi:MAG: hypothetical protein K2X74_16135 [Acetobacteraceae bacterium]|nr:hypothetical protein [Acetobacteraceae bacterium]